MESPSRSADAPVLVWVEEALGRIRLNRPKALNSLTLEMITAIGSAFDHFESNPAVTVVVIDGAGERGFCAGADITAFHSSALVGGASAREFLHWSIG